MSEAIALEADAAPTLACPVCAAVVPRKSSQQVTCGAPRCRSRRAYLLDKADPAKVEQNRERCRRWYAAKQGDATTNPWLLAAPAFAPFLPGGGMELRIEPYPTWPIELRNTRALHAMLTAMTGLAHDHVPPFAAVPWRCRSGWGVYVRDEATARRLAGRTHDAVLFDKQVRVTTSMLFRLRTPAAPKRGRQRVRIEAITPICIRNDGNETTYTAPTAVNFVSSLGRSLAPRLGVEVHTDDLRVEVIERDTQPATVQLGGKYGPVRGWTGSVVLEVNAPAAWLLHCSALIGLGGRVAFGFGRVVVTGC